MLTQVLITLFTIKILNQIYFVLESKGNILRVWILSNKNLLYVIPTQFSKAHLLQLTLYLKSIKCNSRYLKACRKQSYIYKSALPGRNIITIPLPFLPLPPPHPQSWSFYKIELQTSSTSILTAVSLIDSSAVMETNKLKLQKYIWGFFLNQNKGNKKKH